MSFHDEVINAFPDIIDEYQLIPVIETERTTTLVRKKQYALSVSWTNHFEIDFCYFFVKDNKIVSTFPMFIIGKYRQEQIPRAKLIQGSNLRIDALHNFGVILNAAGQDFLRGPNEIANNEEVAPHLNRVSHPMVEFYEKYVVV